MLINYGYNIQAVLFFQADWEEYIITMILLLILLYFSLRRSSPHHTPTQFHSVIKMHDSYDSYSYYDLIILYYYTEKKKLKGIMYLTVVSFCVGIKLVSGSLITLEYFSMSCRRQGSSTPSAIISSHFSEPMLAPSN